MIEPHAAWEDEQVKTWLGDPDSMNVEAATVKLQSALRNHYDSRAKTLQDIHPLGIQVNLATGVANGVLVVRTINDCARLVKRIVTRTLELSLADEEGATVLREDISGSVFRIATKDAMLTNAFWNFYLDFSE